MRTKAFKRLYRIRRIIIAAAALIAVTVFFIINAFRNVETASNERAIYDFLTSEMGLNTAAACGVLANIEEESDFSSDNMEKGYTWAQGAGYGICQWTNYPRTSTTGRRTDLVDWCLENGYDYKTLSGQLEFLQYELNSNPSFKESVTERLKSVTNDEQGAYEAGYYWCYYFEVPDGYDDGVSESRGNSAMKKYWPKYCEEV